MFASELAKPSSLCLGAFEPETGKLIGYLIISRYVDAWHVMNVAVEPGHRRQGIASLLLTRLFELTAGRSPPRLHARGARLERGRDQALRGARLPSPRRPARLLHRQPRGRADHVEGPGLGAGDALLILGLETSCDETAAALRGRWPDSSATSSRRRPTCTPASAGSCPRSRRGGTSSSSCR